MTKLANIDAQRLLMGLRVIDSDDATKLDAEVRMKIAININRLMPNVQAFERIVGKMQVEAEQKPINGHSVVDELNSLAYATEDYKLKKLDVVDLKLKDNPKIKSDTLARIAIILRNFDDGDSDE